MNQMLVREVAWKWFLNGAFDRTSPYPLMISCRRITGTF